MADMPKELLAQLSKGQQVQAAVKLALSRKEAIKLDDVLIAYHEVTGLVSDRAPMTQYLHKFEKAGLIDRKYKGTYTAGKKIGADFKLVPPPPPPPPLAQVYWDAYRKKTETTRMVALPWAMLPNEAKEAVSVGVDAVIAEHKNRRKQAAKEKG